VIRLPEEKDRNNREQIKRWKKGLLILRRRQIGRMAVRRPARIRKIAAKEKRRVREEEGKGETLAIPGRWFAIAMDRASPPKPDVHFLRQTTRGTSFHVIQSDPKARNVRGRRSRLKREAGGEGMIG
jgi:hypothetical protein